ncbi:hypothetical protein GAZ13_26555 [Bacteroides xylanisolvens]|nr:hypothetical protein GAZ19_23805 [Bacteroides xylanisolvens]KAB6410014.1 hypothetical protein GAZ18_25625 [Bacteroides xylanisolvens]KAB6417662.1 hypothetical protein GAZ14_25570 [Bacteroides xylanisolvens]KAB6430017.1 hypothetical protein GAZ16_25325 [Bacteroides xylanisolvens]KAB6431098.1 hypothetical protein GAZ13_26555 [Bacteroides xylanisolvens]
MQYPADEYFLRDDYVVLLKAVYTTSRTSGNKYTIRNENPRGFKEHTGRIATKENNLLKLFIL